MAAAAALAAVPAVLAASPLPYLDPSLPWDDRVADLVGRMTLDEKATQMTNNAGAIDRLNVSSYAYWTECNSGIGVGYPQNINMAATFNRSLVFAAGRGTGFMLRARAGGKISRLSCWSPMMNIMRHPLWGRNHEGYGEDPYLSGEMAFALVRGLQGHGLEGYPRYALAAAGCKHFAAFDGPANAGDAIITDADWFWNYMPNFEQCVNAGSYSLMCTYARHDAPTPPPVPHCAVQQVLGCFADNGQNRVLPQQAGTVGTQEECAGQCRNLGYSDESLFGVENGNQCFCAHADAHGKLENATAGACAGRCSGDKNESCGGGWAITVFRASCPGPVPPPTLPTFGCMNERALTTVLRDTWSSKEDGVPGIGKGFVVSDCGAVHDIPASLKAGCDLECGRGYSQLANLTRSGAVTEAELDRALSRMMYVRMRLGEWDPPASVPFRNTTAYDGTARSPALEQLSAEAARQSMVLLKNDGVLPLRVGGLARVAVVGIEGEMFAGYNTGGGRTVKTSDAMRAALGAAKEVRVAAGCTDGPACGEYDAGAVAAAARGADLAVVFVGTGGLEGESVGGPGDLRDLELRGNQTALLDDVLRAAPKAVVVVLLACNPLNISGIVADPRVRAVLQAGYPQHRGGDGIVDVLVGKYNPSGRLPYTWPRGDGSKNPVAGDMSNYTMLGTQKTYRYGYPDPLFPFGYGLSYTTWQYSALSVSPRTVKPCDSVTVSATVANTGEVDGSEVTQVYVKWVSPGQPTPKVQLVNFDKTFVRAGGSAKVGVTIDARHMALLRVPPRSAAWAAPAWWVTPGDIEVHVGGGQPGYADTLLGKFTVSGAATAVTNCH